MNQKVEFEEEFVMEDTKKSIGIDLFRAAAGYGRLTIKYQSAPRELAAIEELWQVILRATDTSAIDWTEKSERVPLPRGEHRPNTSWLDIIRSDRGPERSIAQKDTEDDSSQNKPATPRVGCEICMEREASLNCVCGAPLCDYCCQEKGGVHEDHAI